MPGPLAFTPAQEAISIALSLGLCAAIAAADVALGGSAVLIAFLSVAPLVASTRGRVRNTIVAAAVAVALAIVLGFVGHRFAATDHVVRVAVVAVVSALAIWIAASRRRLEWARFRYGLIADAGTVMASGLDYEVSLIELARLCARQLCDWCFVFIEEDDGTVRQLAAAHVDPARQRAAWELLLRYPLDPNRPEGPAKVIRTGRPDLQPVVSDELLEAIAYDDENLRLLRALDLRSAMITPLVGRDGVLGAIAFATAESRRVLGREDLALAEELSARAAISVDNIRLYTRLSAAEQQLRASNEQLAAILGGVADAVTAQDAAGRLIYANDAAARQLGLASAEEMIDAWGPDLAAGYEMTDAEGRPFTMDDLPGRRALRGEDPEPALVRYYDTRTGEESWSVVKATAIRDDEGRPQLAINVVEDVTEGRRREQQQRLLADTSGVLASSLDMEETLPRVAELVAGQISDWCAIDVANGDGSARRIASAGAPREGASEISVPLEVRGRTLGTISLAASRGTRPLDDADRLLVEELAGRCALALDNARLYAERSQIARTLQQSLLPPVLPDLPGLDVSARFRAAGAGIEVGGDFYDVFETGDSTWAVAIGDVCGKGSEAAAITALARYTVRAASMRQDAPSHILSLLNEALLRQRSDRRFCTVLYGRVSRDGDGASFEFASGGHPLPLLLRGPEGGSEVGAPGTLLGVVPDPSLGDERVALEPGDALVLYTDGVTDAGAPRSLLTASDLAAAVGAAHRSSADEIAERVLQAAVAAADGEPRDDIALVVLKVPDDGKRAASV